MDTASPRETQDAEDVEDNFVADAPVLPPPLEPRPDEEQAELDEAYEDPTTPALPQFGAGDPSMSPESATTGGTTTGGTTSGDTTTGGTTR